MKHRGTAWAILMSMALLASGCWSSIQASQDGPLTASGSIHATEIRIASEFGGRLQTIPVQTGAEVRAGDVLVTLDATPYQLQLTPAEAAVSVAKADLAVTEAGPHPAEIEAARAALTLAEAQRDGALKAWENAKAAIDHPQDLDAQIVKARTQVDLAAQGVELAEAQLAREQMLRDQQPEGSVQRQAADLQVKAAEEALAASQADEKAAKALLNQLLGIRKEPLGYIAQANAAEGQYRVAEEAVAVAQAKLQDLLDGPTPEEVAVAKATVDQAEAQANVLRLQVKHNTIISPIDGVVVEQAVRAGEIVAPAATILVVADLSEVSLEVFVQENRIGQVRLGQTVHVTIDSFPGKTFEGRVVRIGNQPEFTPRNIATAEERVNTFYAVEIRLPNPERLLKPGMPADAAF